MKKKSNEIGWNYLNTSLSGRSNPALSGLPGVFDFVGEDKGVASKLSDKEFGAKKSPQISAKDKRKR
jgi:hypothetical protein